jgi:hypothetical protein
MWMDTKKWNPTQKQASCCSFCTINSSKISSTYHKYGAPVSSCPLPYWNKTRRFGNWVISLSGWKKREQFLSLDPDEMLIFNINSLWPIRRSSS